MTDPTTAADETAPGLQKSPDRNLKGQAMAMIAEQNQLRQDKTERLKALRLAQAAAEPPAQPKTPRRKPGASASSATPKPRAKRAPRAAEAPSPSCSG